MILPSPQFTLIIGIILSLILRNSKIQLRAKKLSAYSLQLSVIFLGASLNFKSVITQGADGALITFISILIVFSLGFVGRKMLKVNKVQGLLLTMGTAICGGSAIGALAPVIKADSIAIGISLGIVFLLNALALFISPPLGEIFGLTQDQFGLWAALAIHDTSSVVAAGAIYGERALEVATTVKLIRALWIIPIVLFFSVSMRSESRKITIPWFIAGFLMVSLAFTFLQLPEDYKTIATTLSKVGFSLTLLLIGLSFNFKEIRSVGLRPFIFGFGLWIMVGALSMMFVKFYN